MRRFRQWVRPVPNPAGGDGRWGCGHLWSGRQPSTLRFDPAVNQRPHLGLDIAGTAGSKIVSPDDGIIESWGWDSLGGWTLVIQHLVRYRNGTLDVWSRHCHCLREKLVMTGQSVLQGQPVAYLGSTGASASAHDHTGITLTPHLPDWRTQRRLFIDPEPIYYPGRFPFMQRGHPYPKEVKKLQTRLNQLGANPQLVVDGDYGAKTEAAVKQFQHKVGIEETGACSELTLSILFGRLLQPKEA